MASTKVLLLQLLLVSVIPVVSASHYWGASTTFTYKGNNSDGTHKVRFRYRDTFDSCFSSLNWRCTSGNCGYISGSKTTVIDSSNNGPQFDRLLCETETVVTRNVRSDKPFQLRADSCCWIGTRNWVVHWDVLTGVDLGKRSDTGEPNKSPDVTILPFLRIPQNCPRTYKLMTFDPDGDDVRCRYGNLRNTECSRCDRPAGFHLDEDSCTLHYISSTANPRVFGFEMMVEDYSKGHINLFYSDGSWSHRHPWPRRRSKRAVSYPTTAARPWWNTAGPTTAARPWWNTARPTTTWLWWIPTRRRATTTWPWWIPTTTPWPTTTTTTPWPTTTWPWWIPTATRWPTTTTPWPTTTTTWPTTTWPTTTTPWPTTTTTWPWWIPTTTMTTTQRPITPYASTPPLSQLPLQFSFLVDPPAPSCVEGVYLPKLVHPTPIHGEKIHAEVDSSMEIRVKAQASLAVIQGIIISGPSNVTKHKTTHNEFVIRWMPTADDLGEFFPICFAVESATGLGVTRPPVAIHSHSHSHFHPTPTSRSGLYHSEMRCVVVEVKRKIVQSHVICNESSMTILVEKASFSRLSEDHLRLNDPSNTICNLTSNSTHIIGVVPLNQCGTQIEEDDDNLIFKNEITTYEDMRNVITRKHLLEVRFYCQYPKHGKVSQSFSVHRKNVTVWEKGMGTFTYGFEFYEDNSYRAMINPNSYPLEVEIGTELYMKIEATSSINNTEMFVESCRAAPYDNPNYRKPYIIIANGCKVDPTVDIYPRAHNKQFLFSMEAFKFIGLHDQVYISCSVIMCEAGNPNTRCSQGCINSTSSHRLYKREAMIQSGTHFVSQGPLRLKRSAENSDTSAVALNLNLVFIAGCVLAAVGMICGVIMYKTKASKVKYQPLPASEPS
uniref:ZP domain-containing protein n=1 Tax=Amphiprion ocellaris TaxID=80972 RepID=A0AAQ5Z142_AMPOC